MDCENAKLVNATRRRLCRLQLAWPLLGLLIAVISTLTIKISVTLGESVLAFVASAILAIGLSATPVGTRLAAFVVGLLCSIPCLLDASPIARALMVCLMAVPLLAVCSLVLVPPIPSLRSRLGYLFTWAGTHDVTPRVRAFEPALLFRLFAATLILAAALSISRAFHAYHEWSVIRWLFGALAILALAEMITACIPFVSGLFGVTVPPLMQSPWLSKSVSEFWTQRWNIFASQKLFRPFCFAPFARRSASLGIFMAFAASAVIHWALAYMALGQMRMALACGAFFLVQPLLIWVERGLKMRRRSLVARHVWTVTALAAASPLFVEPVLQIVDEALNSSPNIVPPTAVVLAFVLGLSTTISTASLAACCRKV